MIVDHLAEQLAHLSSCHFQCFATKRRGAIDATRCPTNPTLLGDEIAFLLHRPERRIERAGAQPVAVSGEFPIIH